MKCCTQSVSKETTMPSDPKRRRTHKKKNVAVAAREKTENEAPLTASSKENSPVMQTERTDGVTAVFDEPTIFLPRRTVLMENMLASEILDLKRKDTKEGTKENALPTEIYSSEKSPDDKINVVGESSAVAAPCVIELDSEDEDGDSMMSPENPVPTETCSSVLVSEPPVMTDNAVAAPYVIELDSEDDDGDSMMSPENPVPTETCSSVLVSEPPVMTDNAVAAPYVIELDSEDDDGDSMMSPENPVPTETCSSVLVSEPPVMTDNAVISLTTKPCDLDLLAVECLNTEDAVFTDLHASEDQRTLEHEEDNAVKKNQDLVTPRNRVAMENKETATLNEVDAPEKSESVQVNEVEAAMKNQEAAVSEYVSDIEKNTLEAVVENQETAAANEVEAPENTKAVQEGEMEVAVKNQEAAISEDVSEKFETIPNNLEAVVAAKPAVDIIYQTHDADQLKVIKEILEDVLNRLNALELKYLKLSL